MTENCTRFEVPPSPRDLAVYKDYVIVSTSEYVSPDLIGTNKGKSGSLGLLDPRNRTYDRLVLQNFPDDVVFNPAGLNVLEDRIFVVNNAGD